MNFQMTTTNKDHDRHKNVRSMLELMLPLRVADAGSVLEQPVHSVLSPDLGLSSCLLYYDVSCPNTCVDSLVMQTCVSAASCREQFSRDPSQETSSSPTDPASVMDDRRRVLVIMGGQAWTQLPCSWHLMPSLSPDIMKTISFIYPKSSKDLVKYLNKLSQKDYPDTIIVSEMHKLVEKDHDSSIKRSSSRQFSKNFAKLTAVLTDFSSFYAKKKSRACNLFIFSQLDPMIESVLSQKFNLWFYECWKMEKEVLRCKSSPTNQSIKFFMKEEQYYLETLEYSK